MQEDTAIEWHSNISNAFDHKYDQNINFIERYALWVGYIAKYSCKSYKAMDFGCGSGRYSILLSKLNNSVIGVDASDEMLSLCNKYKSSYCVNNLEFIKEDLNILPTDKYKNNNLIVSSSVLEYLDDLDKAIEVIGGSLSVNGIFIFSLPNRQSIYRKIEILTYKLTKRPRYYKYVKHTISVDKAIKLLTANGFKTLEFSYYARTPVLSRLFMYLGLQKYSDNLFIIVARKI